MKLHWQDTRDRAQPDLWRGLRVDVSAAARPGLAVTACTPRWIRIAMGETALLWARVAEDHLGYELLRARGPSPGRVLPPVPFEVARHHASLESETATERAWAVYYAQALQSSAASPLYDGAWLLAHSGPRYRERELPADVVGRIVAQKPYGYVSWDFGDELYPITLRDMSNPNAGRVKAYRKLARDRTLPPVLLHWVSGLDGYVVLDGHDRLLAAHLEGVAAPALALEAVREWEPDEAQKAGVLRQAELKSAAAERERALAATERLARARRPWSVESMNALLLETFTPGLFSRPTRARPLEGGSHRWAEEVRKELAARGIEESTLLDGLE